MTVTQAQTNVDLLGLIDLEHKLQLDKLTEHDGEDWDEIDAEIAAHEEHGFYVPTREELMVTTGEFLVHLMMERE